MTNVEEREADSKRVSERDTRGDVLGEVTGVDGLEMDSLELRVYFVYESKLAAAVKDLRRQSLTLASHSEGRGGWLYPLPNRDLRR